MKVVQSIANRVHIELLSHPKDVLFVCQFESTIKRATTAQYAEGNASK
jgi:hypothetical protein